MTFNAVEFGLFFALFFTLYWFVFRINLKYQNIFLLIGSYIFYGMLDWTFLPLIIVSSLFSYIGARLSASMVSETSKDVVTGLAVLQVLGVLLFFKFTNFFTSSFQRSLAVFSGEGNFDELNLIIPIGLSFYTFKIISYLVDVRNEKIDVERDWAAYFSYVSFFPVLLAGPIDRAHNFLRQYHQKRNFNNENAKDALRQILWGLFKKIVIANNCAVLADAVFDHPSNYPASALVLGSFFYFIQVYADFSGYSDMAIGTGKLLGFDITKNFHFPLFASNLSEFWRRWHISLTTWMTDYVFTPLSFYLRKLRRIGIVIAIIINFVVIGLWHGSSWTFVCFGLLQGCLFIPIVLAPRGARKNLEGSPFKTCLKTLFNFLLMMMAFVLLRSTDLTHAFQFYKNIFSTSLFEKPRLGIAELSITFIFIGIMLSVEWLNRKEAHGLVLSNVGNLALRWLIYLTIFIMIGLFGGLTNEKFIYFQF